ncbi:MAG: type II toxin-antitoxin system RelE/ParE family toxin [Deltaproteobacteria bacterium]|nr:MAG: type II toxin-antitoxin system RelE/ParE family toxin [Deltaproteobacteria bacterium]
MQKFRRYERNIILDSINEQLRHQPTTETKNRKFLRDNPLSDWELRVDPFRIFYEVDDSEFIVRIVAVGYKKRERLFIGKEEFKL